MSTAVSRILRRLRLLLDTLTEAKAGTYRHNEDRQERGVPEVHRSCVNSCPASQALFFVGPIGQQTLALASNLSPDFLDDHASRSDCERRCDLRILRKGKCTKSEDALHEDDIHYALESRRRLVVMQDNTRKLYREKIARSTPGRDFPSSASWRVGKLGMPSSDFFPAFQNLIHVTSFGA
jgi:hypothetical protein